ncbi:MAG: hypothetical protein ACKVP7_09275 [Hyphomicrobiaceae bacterium]
MGNFYVSFAVRSADQAAVAACLKGRQRVAFVAPESAGFVHVYDQQADEQDPEVIADLGTALSKDLETVVLAVMNHDDDILCYWLFDNGAFVDAYNSFPGYFGSEDDDEDDGVLPKGGDAALLVRTLGAKTSAKKVHDVLRADNEREDYVFAFDRHAALAKLLGLRPEHACLGYIYALESDASEITDREAFLEVT